MTKRILVAVDGTQASNIALEITCALADKYDANLGLLCIVEPDELTDEAISAGIHEGLLGSENYRSWHHSTIGAGADRYFEEVQRGAYASRIANAVAESTVARAKSYAKDSKAKAIKTFIRSGDVADAILDVAQSEMVDLIVMGHDQRGKLESLIHRSVAKKVERKATCPCLVYCLPNEN